MYWWTILAHTFNQANTVAQKCDVRNVCLDNRPKSINICQLLTRTSTLLRSPTPRLAFQFDWIDLLTNINQFNRWTDSVLINRLRCLLKNKKAHLFAPTQGSGQQTQESIKMSWRRMRFWEAILMISRMYAGVCVVRLPIYSNIDGDLGWRSYRLTREYIIQYS